MPTLRKFADAKVIEAYGTSESVRKAWDTRGRGRKQRPTSSNKSRISTPVGSKFVPKLVPSEELPFTKEWEQSHKYPKEEDLTDEQRAAGKKLVSQYKKLGGKIMTAHGKLHEPENVNSTVGKFLHLLKDVSEWHEAWQNIKDMILEAGAFLWLTNRVAHAQVVHDALVHAYHTIGPVMMNMATAVGSNPVHRLGLFGSEDKDFAAGSFSLRAAADGKTFNGHQLR